MKLFGSLNQAETRYQQSSSQQMDGDIIDAEIIPPYDDGVDELEPDDLSLVHEDPSLIYGRDRQTNRLLIKSLDEHGMVTWGSKEVVELPPRLPRSLLPHQQPIKVSYETSIDPETGNSVAISSFQAHPEVLSSPEALYAFNKLSLMSDPEAAAIHFPHTELEPVKMPATLTTAGSNATPVLDSPFPTTEYAQQPPPAAIDLHKDPTTQGNSPQTAKRRSTASTVTTGLRSNRIVEDTTEEEKSPREKIQVALSLAGVALFGSLLINTGFDLVDKQKFDPGLHTASPLYLAGNVHEAFDGGIKKVKFVIKAGKAIKKLVD